MINYLMGELHQGGGEGQVTNMEYSSYSCHFLDQTSLPGLMDHQMRYVCMQNVFSFYRNKGVNFVP